MDRWVLEEMGAVDLKDKRRNDRAFRVLESLSAVGDSTPDSVRSVAALKATYRLMDMEQVTPPALLAPHREQTIVRTSAQRRVLLVQDMTEVDLTRPQRQVEGAGPLTSNHSYGFYLHPMLAYTDQGVPLGGSPAITLGSNGDWRLLDACREASQELSAPDRRQGKFSLG